MKKNRTLALALPVLLALASCDNNLIEQPEQGNNGNGTGNADQPAYIVNDLGDTLCLVTPMVEMAPAVAATRAEQTPKTYDMGQGMTLKVIPDAPKATRSVSALTAGTLVQMYVYDSNKNYIANSMRQYTVGSDGKLTGTDGGLYLPLGSYTVYCFTDAANTTGTWTTNYTITPSTTLSTATVAVPQGSDAAWGSGTVTVGMYSPNVVKTSLGRMCAQISNISFLAYDDIVTSLSVNSLSLTNVGMGTADAVAFDDGSVTPEAGTTRGSITPSDFSAASNITTFPYTASSTPTYLLPQTDGVNFACQVVINGRTTAVDYSKSNILSSLSAGNSYTLQLTISAHSFAYSNIFWDGVGLNFYVAEGQLVNPDHVGKDGYNLTGNEGAEVQRYQGVFFRWGSLVAIDPSSNSTDLTAVKAYAPDPNDGTYHETTVDLSSASTGPYCFADRGNLAGEDINSLLSYAPDPTQVGDVCSQINAAWRIPKKADFKTDEFIVGGTSQLSFSGTTLDNGKYELPENGDYSINIVYNKYVYLPGDGYRSSTGSLSGIGMYGRYWLDDGADQASTSSWVYGFTNYGTTPNINPTNFGNNVRSAMSIRCVRKADSVSQ
ncbi:MAG: hypothetical protein LBN24_08730 [Mediterranea sp.]|jgi:hypothetical protein|nr:hypothetical protein [Mediterranea sp.]